MFGKIKIIDYKYFLWLAFTILAITTLLFFAINSVHTLSESDQNIFAYTVKIRNTVEDLDKIFERAELNVSVMCDSISNSYDTKKQQDKAYNLHFVKEIDGLVKSVLSNSPSINGSWFQINANLPFSVYAYNWYELKGNEFVNLKGEFEGTPSMDRKMTPEDDPYYFNAINSKGLAWSDIYTDADTKTQMMTISSPAYKDGVLIGVVGIDISIENLKQVLQNIQEVLGESELYLLDKNNNVILSEPPVENYSNNTNYLFLDLFKENKEGPVEYYDYFTKKTAIMLKLSNDYKIVISIKNSVLFYESTLVVKVIQILFGLLVIILTAIFVNQFNKKRPIEIIKPPKSTKNKIKDIEAEIEKLDKAEEKETKEIEKMTGDEEN